MTKAHKAAFQAIQQAVGFVAPTDWDYTLRLEKNGRVVMIVRSARDDLLAALEPIEGRPLPGYVKINPLAYEDRDDLPINRVWLALHSQNGLEFDADGERTGVWFPIELWVGHYRAPFCVAAVQ